MLTPRQVHGAFAAATGVGLFGGQQELREEEDKKYADAYTLTPCDAVAHHVKGNRGHTCTQTHERDEGKPGNMQGWSWEQDGRRAPW